MLSNGWYWNGDGYASMGYPVEGWKVRCKWEQNASGTWSMVMSATEEDPAPWLPGEAVGCRSAHVRAEMDGRNEWASPSPFVMEELSRRVGGHRVSQIIEYASSVAGEPHRVYTSVKHILDKYA